MILDTVLPDHHQVTDLRTESWPRSTSCCRKTANKHSNLDNHRLYPVATKWEEIRARDQCYTLISLSHEEKLESHDRTCIYLGVSGEVIKRRQSAWSTLYQSHDAVDGGSTRRLVMVSWNHERWGTPAWSMPHSRQLINTDNQPRIHRGGKHY